MNNNSNKKAEVVDVVDTPVDTFVPWSAMKPGILQTYTTDEQIGITVVSVN